MVARCHLPESADGLCACTGLATVMAGKEAVWDEIVAKHGLAPTPYRDVSSWAFGDAVFSWDYDLIADGSKARRYGPGPPRPQVR